MVTEVQINPEAAKIQEEKAAELAKMREALDAILKGKPENVGIFKEYVLNLDKINKTARIKAEQEAEALEAAVKGEVDKACDTLDRIFHQGMQSQDAVKAIATLARIRGVERVAIFGVPLNPNPEPDTIGLNRLSVGPAVKAKTKGAGKGSGGPRNPITVDGVPYSNAAKSLVGTDKEGATMSRKSIIAYHEGKGRKVS